LRRATDPQGIDGSSRRDFCQQTKSQQARAMLQQKHSTACEAGGIAHSQNSRELTAWHWISLREKLVNMVHDSSASEAGGILPIHDNIICL